MPSILTVYSWELRKLVHQKRTYLGLFAAMAVPIIFVLALALNNGQPDEVAFGRYVRDSGLAIPPVILIFGSYWLFPLITALVSGDIVAAEDHNGTLKTILTRSVQRGRIFAAKTLAAFTYAFAALLLMGITAIVAGVLESGFNPLVSLSGTTVSAGRGLALIFASFAVYMLPLLAVASIALLLSTVTRNSAAAVVGALMISLLLQLVTIIPGLQSLLPYLLPTQFNAWQGFLRTPVDWAPVIRAAWVCALYAIPCLAVAFTVFSRRDVAGG
jgi:ABC-2 type transport system permease protein